MTADERALIQAIIANPDDDLPRLVYADWLDEHGRPERAEFIRVQCELARVRIADPGGRERYDRLNLLYQGLHASHSREWGRAALDGLPPNRQLGVMFHRGMVGEVWCSLKYFLEHGARLFERFPVETILLNRLSEAGAQKLAGCPHFVRPSGLRIDARTDSADAVVAVLAACPLGHLRSLTVSDNIIDGTPCQRGPYTPVAEFISRCDRLTGLTRLDLSGAKIGDSGGAALANSSALGGLTYLDVMHNSLSDGVQDLLRDRYGPALVLDYADRQRFPLG